MTEEQYSPYKLAIELGFTEEKAKRFDWNGTNATNMRRIAERLGLPSTKPDLPSDKVEEQPSPEPKTHRHSYRKDGSCACGEIRKAPKQSRKG